MPIISAVGLFCCDKFEETPNKKVSNLSKLSKSYFKSQNTEQKNCLSDDVLKCYGPFGQLHECPIPKEIREELGGVNCVKAGWSK